MCPAAEDAERVERRHTWVPPYRETYKVCVGAALCPAPTQGKMISMKNVIPRSAATWESVSPVWQEVRCGGITDCRTGVRAGAQ